jgi:general stress protein 26
MKEKRLSRPHLQRLITEFLQTQIMCVLATCGEKEPRASAVEFFPDGLTLYILTEGGRKIDNLKKNPRVSVAVYTQFLGWDNIKGLQIAGTAGLGASRSAIFREGVRAYRRRRGRKDALVPNVLKVIKIIPDEIEYLDTTLKAKGYGVWHALKI